MTQAPIITPIITHVVAIAKNGVIGNKGALPWHIKGELQWFKRHTVGKPVIMGRKTWESLPKKPLIDRLNIILTRDRDFKLDDNDNDGAVICHDLDAALAAASAHAQAISAPEIAIIGGGELYQQTLPLCGRLYLTRIDISPAGDAFYPDLKMDNWHETYSETGPTAAPTIDHPNGFGCTFKIYDLRGG
ncbi:MAG: dihydrofolate reductase [Alphaproteobacteria bacterium]